MNKEYKIVGRKHEIEKLEDIYLSGKSEFVVLYGRRRVGKTYLIKEYFRHKFTFQFSGLANASNSQQLQNFHTSLADFSKKKYKSKPENWLEAIDRLKIHIESIKSKEKKLIFIDELPWLATRNSDFITALENFWNGYASDRKDIVLIVCGSAASWMINELINNKGGLHNRITAKLKIQPFSLSEVEEFLKMKGCKLDRYQICELYMTTGGIPYYLDAIESKYSATQNIQYLFFSENSPLNNEFHNLFRSLFTKYEIYEKLVEVLASKLYGMTRKELTENKKLSSGGTLTKILTDLEESGFIQSYDAIDGKPVHRIYRLSDFYTLFYFRFIIKNKYKGEDAWQKQIDSPTHRAWQGFTYEQICMHHIPQIKKALGISGIFSSHLSWHGSAEGQSAQIDLLIDRNDHVINICEIKFSLSQFIITKDYAEKLRKKLSLFKQISKTKKSVFLTMMTSYGVHINQHSNALVQNSVVMDDLFQ